MSQLVTILRGLWEFHELRAEYDLAIEFGNQLLAFAQEQQDTSLLLVAHDVLGDTFVWLGDFVAARNHLEQGIALYDAEQHHSHVFLYGYDSGMACLSFLALPLWYLGYSDQALKRAEEALGMARALSQSLGLIQILFFTAWIHQLRGERDVAQEQVEEVIATSDEQGFPVYSAAGRLLQGLLLTEQGKAEEGVALMRAGSDAHRAAGTQLGFSVWSGGWLGEALIRMGSIEEGSKLLSDALAFVDRTGERFHEGELYRLKGEAFLKLKKDSSEAENCFLQAIEAAQRQQAKSTELRAVMSLCRLWQKEGETERARAMLANSYDWFSEGFDTADLKDAKALLSELQEVDRGVGASLRRTGQPR
jgi:tetratricopeptide (TPR) repeat protein